MFFCVGVKRIMLCDCLCSSSPSSRFSASLICIIGEFGAKSILDHETANTVQLFVPGKMNFFWSTLFYNKSRQSGIPQRLIDKSSNLFIWQKQAFTVKNPIQNKQGVTLVTDNLSVLYFEQVFVIGRVFFSAIMFLIKKRRSAAITEQLLHRTDKSNKNFVKITCL